MRPFAAFWWLVMLLALAGCATVGHHEAGIGNFDIASPTLYRGAQPSQQGIQTLAQMHVKTIINLRNADDTQEAQWVRDAGMFYIHLPLDAGTVTAADADHFLALLASAQTPVFVHCLGGRDRTGLAVAAYRVCVQHWAEQDAVRDLLDHGHLWLWYPKVRAAVAELAQRRPAAVPVTTVAAPVLEPMHK